MGLFNNSCSRCWESPPYCKCTPEEMKEYYRQAEINRNKPVKITEPYTGDRIAEGIDENGKSIKEFYVREVSDEGIISGEYIGTQGITTWPKSLPYIKISHLVGEHT